MGIVSPEALIWINSFPFKQKARYLPSREIAADETGLSAAKVVRGLKEISLDFSCGFTRWARIRQRTKDPAITANETPTRLILPARERMSRVNMFGCSATAMGAAGSRSISLAVSPAVFF